jgi:hypothetical protein
VIGAEKDPTKQLDWSTKCLNHSGPTRSAQLKGNQSTSNNIGKQWTVNWHIQKDNKSAVSKLSSMGESIETICFQLTLQQQENKTLSELTEQLKDESKKEAKRHKQQISEQDQKWKQHMDTKTAAFSTRMKQGKLILRQQPTRPSKPMRQ